MLDLVITDIPRTNATVLPLLSDHCMVMATLDLPAPTSRPVSQTVWNFAGAEWERLQTELCEGHWDMLEGCDPGAGAVLLTDVVMTHCEACIEQHMRSSTQFSQS